MMTKDEILARFEDRAGAASFFLASDYGDEYKEGYVCIDECLALWDANPDLHNQMMDLASGNLWSLELTLANRERMRNKK